MNKGTNEKIELILTLARAGDFGTPDCPDRLSSGRVRFWNAYEGLLDPKSLKGTVTYPYAVAGLLYKEERIQ